MANYLDHVLLDEEYGNKKVYVKPGLATLTTAGLMSAADKKKLDEIEAGANFYELPVAASTILGGVKIGYANDGAKIALDLSSENRGFTKLTKSAIVAALGFIPVSEDDIPDLYVLPVATGIKLGGIKIEYDEKDGDLAVKLDSYNKAYIKLTRDAIIYALGFTPANSENGYSLPVATSSVLGGVKIGYSNTGANVAVKLDIGNKSYVELTSTAIKAALGYTPQDSAQTGLCNLDADVFSSKIYDDGNISDAITLALTNG